MHPAISSDLARFRIDDLVRRARDARLADTSTGRFGALRRMAIAIVMTCTALPITAASTASAEPAFNIDCDSIGETGTPFVRGINCRAVDVDGYPREYIVYVPHAPSFRLDKETPVVFHYHGSGGSAEVTLTESEWAQKAEDVGIVTVFGSGLRYFECTAPDCSSGQPNTKWNNRTFECGVAVDCDIRQPGYPGEPAPWPADDVKFTDEMLADVRSGLAVDPRRIYLSGFSHGAGMALRLALERSSVFAAVGTAGGGTRETEEPAQRYMPLYYAIGDRDGHLLEDIHHADDAPQEPIASIPLTYDEAFSFSAVRSRFDAILAPFGMSNVPTDAWEFKNELRVRYDAPLAHNPDGNEIVVSFQKGVVHQFANADENPEGFHDPDLFWKFFHDHPLPK